MTAQDAPTEPTAETEQPAQGETETDSDNDNAAEDADGSGTGDPLGVYLRRMTSFSLLTREGEVEIAKRIEDGKRRVLEVLLGCSVAVDEILSLGEALRTANLRVTDLVGDLDADDPDFDEKWHVERVCKVFDQIRRVRTESAWKEAASQKVKAT